MRKVTVEVTYIVEIETDLEDKDEIDDFVADYITNGDIEEISDGGTVNIVDYGD